MKNGQVVLLVIFIALLAICAVILFIFDKLPAGIATIIAALIAGAFAVIVNFKKNSKDTGSIGHEAKGKGNDLGSIEIHSSNRTDVNKSNVGHKVDGENIKAGNIKIWKK